MKKIFIFLIVFSLIGIVCALNEKVGYENTYQIKPGNYITYNGDNFEFIDNNGSYVIKEGNISVYTKLKINVEENDAKKVKLKLLFNNGDSYEIKIMPDTASKTALASLRLNACTIENNCTIELKDVGEKNETKIVYELKAQKKSRLFFIFPKKMKVLSQVDIQTGEVIFKEKPAWSFLAKEINEK